MTIMTHPYHNASKICGGIKSTNQF